MSGLWIAFTVIGIATIVLGLTISFVPALLDGLQDDQDDLAIQLPTGPGSEEAEMRRRLEEHPDDVNAMVILADLLANTGRRTEAIRWYEEAVQRRPDEPSLRTAFGVVLKEQGYSLDAELQLKKAHGLAPEQPKPLYVLAQLFEETDPPRLDEARQYYQQVIETAPESVYAERAQERLAELGESG